MAQSKNIDLKCSIFDGTTEDWMYWYERLKIGLRNENIKNEDKKRDILLGHLGPQPFKIVFDSVHPTPINNIGFNDAVEILNKYYTKPCAPLSQRVNFSRRFRHDGESINQFELALRSLAGQCKFGENMDERLRDQFIQGINNDRWQLELLRLHASTTTTFSSVIESATLLENVDLQQREIRSTCINKVNVSERTKAIRPNPKSKHYKPELDSVLRLNKNTHCFRCGNRKHLAEDECPAVGTICKACGGRNHFARACLKVGNAVVAKNKHVNYVKNEFASQEDEVSCSDIDQIRTLERGSKVMINVKLNNQTVSMLYDPGATFSIIGEKLWKTLGAPILLPTEDLTAYTGVNIETLGKTSINVSAFGRYKKLQLIVVKKNDVPLFGLDWVLKFNLPLPPGAKVYTIAQKPISSPPETNAALVDKIIADFPDVFSPSLGTIRNCKVLFHMSKDAIPMVSKPRPVPFSLRKAVEEELQRLVDNHVLIPVNTSEEPVNWSSPVVIVVKPSGAIRICADFKNTINRYILSDNYPMPRFEEITAKLTGGKEFTVIDLKDAYLQMEVDASVQQFLTISTHKGFFRYSRLPFGIKIATGAFQCKMDQVLAGIQGVACLLDDVIITAPTREEHTRRVREVLRRFENAGIRVQTSKCKWFQDSVKYLGHRIDKTGIHPTAEHLEAMKNMPSPKNVKELRSFLGTINYYSKFVPHLQSICVPLHKLLRKGEKWRWSEKHEQIATKLRHLLATSDTLAHYDESLPLILATDASEVGLGAAIFHRYSDGTEKPVAFASRRLDPAESHYSVIEKEALAMIFGVTRFEQYLYGRHFEIRTDHKALIKLFGEHDSIPKVVSNRIARWALTLSAYDYSINYQRGKDNTTADLLSRFPLETKSKSTEERLGDSNRANLFHLRSQDLPLSTKSLQEATKHDSILSKVVNYLRSTWPSNVNDDQNMLPYYNKRDELSFENGVLLWLGRLIIPANLRSRVMEVLHEGHPGIVAMKAKARFQVWWPKLDKDLEEHTKHCIGCQENRCKDTEMPLFSWTVPTEVWSRIHIDFAGPFMGKMWLVVVDARSKWLEVIPTSTSTTKSTMNILEELFSRFGYPKIIVSDNGPQLTSHEFQKFCKDLNIKHARITPYHPKSNGLAERCVRTFKERMNASRGYSGTMQEKLNSFLFAYRTSPKRSTGKTPAYMMFGHELRSKLDLLLPDVNGKIDEELVKQRVYKHESKVKLFEENSDVWVLNQSGSGYKRGKIVKVNGPYSYLVYTDGKNRKCHADQLRAAEPLEEGGKM